MKYIRGFTLIEVIVSVAVLGILSSIVVASMSGAGSKARDADRQADLKTLQAAIELYKQENGRYPARCPSADATWSGEPGTVYACSGSSDYIVDLAPKYIPVLPKEKKLNGTNSGYVYTTNAAGTAYKLMALRTVESETVTYEHSLKSCDATDSGTGICDNTSPFGPWAASRPNHCQKEDARFRSSYGLWGGFPPEPNGGPRAEEQVENVVCR